MSIAHIPIIKNAEDDSVVEHGQTTSSRIWQSQNVGMKSIFLGEDSGKAPRLD